MTQYKFDRFSVFIECSTGSTPRVDTIKQYIDILSAFGYNELYLGCTDAYKIEGEPYFNYKRGGYTTQDFRAIDSYAQSKGITVIASIQTLAHLHFMSRHNVYADLFDTDNIFMVGDDKVYAFIDKMFRAISEGLSTRRIHIGFDEAFGLGLGKYLQKHGYRPKTELLHAHLQRVTQIAAQYGYTCEIWSDMYFREAVEHNKWGNPALPTPLRLPDNTELITWEYDETRKETLRDLMTQTQKACSQSGYAGAAWKINGFAPQNGYSLSRLLPQIDCAVQSGIRHFMITLWSDGGGLVSPFAVLPTLYAAAQYAQGKWNGVGSPDTALFAQTTGAVYADFLLLDYLNDPFRKDIRTKNSRSYWCLFNDILLGNYDLYLSEGTGAKYAALAEDFAAAKVRNKAYAYLFSEAESLSRLLSVKAELGLSVRAAYKAGDKKTLRRIVSEFPDLYRNLQKFADDFAQMWRKENMAFGLECVQLLLGGQRERYRYVENVIRGYTENDEKIEELETETLPPSIIPPTNEDACFEMNWRLCATFCGI